MRRCDRNPQILAVFKQQQAAAGSSNPKSTLTMQSEFCIDVLDDTDDGGGGDMIADDYSSFAELVDDPNNEGSLDEDEDDLDLADESKLPSEEV